MPDSPSSALSRRSSRRGQVIVRLASEEGARPTVLGPGALIGRHSLCALRLDDPRVSEVHAVLRQRGRRMHLAAIGGVIRVGGSPLRDLRLRPGLRVQLLPGLLLDILTVSRPAEVLALQVGDLAPQELVDGCYSLRRAPHLDLVPGQFGDAMAQVIDSGDNWRILLPTGEVAVLRPGKTFQIRRVPVHVLTLPTRSNRAWAAVPGQWRPDPLALRLEERSEVVHIERATRHDLALTGRSADLLRALHQRGGTASPEALAMDLWPTESARFAVSSEAARRRLARAIEELRTVLRSHGVRDDLVRDDGVGNVELYLRAQDGLSSDAPETSASGAGADPFDPALFADEELFAPGETVDLPWVPLLTLHSGFVPAGPAGPAAPAAPAAPAGPGTASARDRAPEQAEDGLQGDPTPAAPDAVVPVGPPARPAADEGETEELLFALASPAADAVDPPAPDAGEEDGGVHAFPPRAPWVDVPDTIERDDAHDSLLFADFGAEAHDETDDLDDQAEEATQVFRRPRFAPQEDE